MAVLKKLTLLFCEPCIRGHKFLDRPCIPRIRTNPRPSYGPSGFSSWIRNPSCLAYRTQLAEKLVSHNYASIFQFSLHFWPSSSSACMLSAKKSRPNFGHLASNSTTGQTNSFLLLFILFMARQLKWKVPSGVKITEA